MPAQTMVDVLYESPARTLEITTENSAPPSRDDKATFQIPYFEDTAYILSATLRDDVDQSYRDLAIKIDLKKHRTILSAQGLTGKETVSLTLNGLPVFTKVPPDWAGRIELSADLTSEDKNNLCLLVENFKGQNIPLSFCHAPRKGDLA